MGVKLYALDLSPPVRACMMACGIFNVPFEKIIVNVKAGENLTPEFLKKNPLHTIPVLEDGDLIIHDRFVDIHTIYVILDKMGGSFNKPRLAQVSSHAILTYLADTYGKDDSWYPKDVKKRTLVNQKLFFNAAVLFQKLRNITKNPLHTIPVLEDGDLIVHDSHAILGYLADTYGKDDSWYPKDVKQRTLVNQKLFFNVAIVFQKLRNITFNVLLKGKKTIEQELLDDVAEGYAFIEAFLSRTKYIAGDHVTIADLSILSTVSTQEQILPIDVQKYPKLKSWLEELKATPYCKKYNEEGANAWGAFIRNCMAS
ncbi:hypothetical protein HF086_003802 [Spodoptera exigua]|uniref:Uncharacterized protein n=1 Tax=Spodoptera exigua TaxID=7107 RepID=A0A922MWK6_SPOEX|nr:hypothetical protein HF086_003802 [Spodoptera exigua]